MVWAECHLQICVMSPGLQAILKLHDINATEKCNAMILGLNYKFQTKKKLLEKRKKGLSKVTSGMLGVVFEILYRQQKIPSFCLSVFPFPYTIGDILMINPMTGNLVMLRTVEYAKECPYNLLSEIKLRHT